MTSVSDFAFGSKTAVDLNLAFVVDPGNPELNHPFRFNKALKNSTVAILLVTFDGRPDRLQHLSHRLKKLRLVGITPLNYFEHLLNESHGIFAAHSQGPGMKKLVRDAGFEPATSCV